MGGSDVTVPVNQNIMLYGYDMWMRGKLEPTGTNLDQTLFITLPTAYAMAASSRTTAVRPLVIPKDSVSSVMVKVKPGQDPGTVARAITAAVPGVTAIVSPQMFAAYRSQISGLLRVMLVVLGLLLVLWRWSSRPRCLPWPPTNGGVSSACCAPWGPLVAPSWSRC